MAEKVLVSVVIPTWNRRDLVCEAVRSVIAQSQADWELIVVDDGSSDGTAAAVEAMNDPRVRMIQLDHSGKVGHLRNAGAQAASARWIAFLDSDDLWLAGKLQIQLDALEASGAGWCYGACELLGPSGEVAPIRAGQFLPLSGDILDDLLTGRTGAYIGTLVVRRDLFDKAGGFDESLANREDLDFELRLAAIAEAVAVPEVVTRVREHEGRRTGDLSFPHERTAIVFNRFRKRFPRGHAARLARRQEAALLTQAGAQRIERHHFAKGASLLLRALALGAPPLFWLRSAAAGLRRAIVNRRG
jgi:glycosyltransferase involved in cell wall biosynthesis